MPDEQSPATGDERHRGRQRSERSHSAVLAATTAVLEEVGYLGLTLEAVAGRAGVSRATIYRWWPSRASLVIEALTGIIQTPSPPATGDTRADLRAVVQATLDHYVRAPLGPNLVVLLIDASRQPDDAARVLGLFGPQRAAAASVLLAAAARGDLPHDVDVHLLHDIVVGTLIFRELLGLPADDRIVDKLTDLIVAGRTPRLPRRTEG